MTKKEFDILIDRYLKGQATDSEKQIIESYLENFQTSTEESIFSSQETMEALQDRLYKKICQDILSKSRRRAKSIIFWLLIGIILGGIGLLYVINTIEKKNQKYHIADSSIQEIVKLETSNNDIETVELSDGTFIHLNENSVLEYPKTFVDSMNRKVTLKGEAFFEVATDSIRPFIVITENLETTVLGTSFNLRARLNEENIEVSLLEGKVSLHSKLDKKKRLLVPYEKYTYHKENASFDKSIFSGNLIYAWKEDELFFDKANVVEVSKALSEKYGVEINIKEKEKIESLLVYRVNTNRYELSKVIKHITKVTDYKFLKNNNKSYTIMSK